MKGHTIVELKGPPGPFDAFSAIRDLPFPFIWGGPDCGRYGYVAACPILFMGFHSPQMVSFRFRNGGTGVTGGRTPFTLLDTLLKDIARGLEKGPFPFSGGGAGFFSYDLKEILFGRGGNNKGGSGPLPLSAAGIYDTVYVYDSREGRGYIVGADIDPFSKDIFGELNRRITTFRPKEKKGEAADRPGARFTSNMTRDAYLRAVEKSLEYIAAGDIYQINLSQCFTFPFSGDPFSLYQAVTGENPTPWSSYFDFGRFQVISNSPERLFMTEGPVMETRPIKGTRPRGGTEAEDRAMIEELRWSKKERAEHVMIVDLERNDIGRFSVPGTVEVAEFERIETYRRLHHMVSIVRGKRLEGVSSLSALEGVFPGGSITGAPKIRAMEIIEELEAGPRGLYTGGIGLVDFSGDMDVAMAIRTAVVKGGRLNLHTGGGIVADSDPAFEYEETILKALDFFNALGKKPRPA